MISSFNKRIFVFAFILCLAPWTNAAKSNKNTSEQSSPKTSPKSHSINISEKSRDEDLNHLSKISHEDVSKKSTLIRKSIVKENTSENSSNDMSSPSQLNSQTIKNSSHVTDKDEGVISTHSKQTLDNEENSAVLSEKTKDPNVTFQELSGKSENDEQEVIHKKKTDIGKDALEKSRSRYEKLGVVGEDYVCKKELMTIFSVQGNQYDKAVKATPREKSYCRRNEYTCCSDFNIASVNSFFGAGRRKLRLKFEVIEELFALFRGPKFIEYVQERKGVEKCAPLVEDLKVVIKGNTYTFFDLGYLRHQMEMAENLLMDTEIYTKKVLWFYGDSICAICSPKVQEYFDFNDKTPKIHMHINTCSERIEEREYERNLLLAYDKFISKTVQFLECTQGVEEAEENGTDPDANSKEDEEGDNAEKATLLPIDEEEKENFLNTFDECWDDQNVASGACQNFCKIDMRKYTFPIKNLFHNLKVSLSVIYSTMAGGNDIADYYENIKGEEWTIQDEDEPIVFFPESGDWKKYNMDSIEWEYHTSTGHNVFKEIMSKKFTSYEESVSKVFTLVMFSLIALLIK
jgi:hypothetical protein